MIVTEHPYEGNDNLVKTFSDAGFYILQNETGNKYDSAVDVYPCRYTYTETDEKIITEESTADELADTKAALKELGVTE